MKKLLSLILAFAFCFAGYDVFAQDQVGEAAKVDRYSQLFDRSGDEGKLVVRFLQLHLAADAETDEKSGDSGIVTTPDGKVMLIDGGSPDCAVQVEAALKAMGVTKIDAIVASHPHIDHIGGLARIMAAYPVDTLYMSKVVYPTSGIYRGFMSMAAKRGIKIVYLEEGSEFALGESVNVKVYNPEPDIHYYEGYPANGTQFINNKSLVMKFAYGLSTMLFMGDVYTPREVELLEKFGSELKADVIKVGHHGSDTSSSKSFVKAVSPKFAVMMHDSFASLQVYKNYRKVGALTYATAIDGCVKIAGDDAGNWTALTQFDRLSDFLK
ncbi:MAG TPA: MBL fold metallo-hydrolase [Rectinemataceae bacterium]|nr:MBL fold metallo-hydrolase [Rectinemataceae bacterium]